MDNNLAPSPFEEEKPRSPIIAIAVLGAVLAGCCVILIGALFLFKPDQLSMVEKLFPSPTPTLTSTPVPSPTPNLTATQRVIQSTSTAQSIQALATDSVSQWPVLFSDTFDSNESKWAVGSDNDQFADVSREIKDGKYSWDVNAKKSVVAWVSPDVDEVSDFRLSAEMKRVSGSDQSDYGLIFREDADGNLYYFGIEDDGFFVLLNFDSEWSDLIKFVKSPAILPEGTNRMSVIADGSHFLFFINDQFVAEITDDHVGKGTTGIAAELYDADLQAAFEFDNFELRAP